MSKVGYKKVKMCWTKKKVKITKRARDLKGCANSFNVEI